MENELTYTPVTDNTLLEFGETRFSLGRYQETANIDITAVFEDNLSFGESKIGSIAIGGRGYINLIGPAGFHQGTLEAMMSNLYMPQNLDADDDTGVYFDINEDRDSIVVTWNNLIYGQSPDGPRQTFQAEIIDRNDDNAEIILRWADTNGDTYYNSQINSYYGSAELNNVLNVRSRDTPTSDLDSRIGNTGVAGVEQILLASGDPFGLTVTGTDVAEVLRGGTLADLIDGAGGDDTIIGGGGQDTIMGGEGNDDITTSKNDYYYYSNDRNGASIDGGAGDDTIRTSDLSDTVIGGDGDDLINGGHGSNDLSGGTGDDVIRFGYSGQSTVDGGNGDDYIDGSFLDDVYPDVYYYGTRTSDITGGLGNDTILGTRSEDIIAAQDGNDSVLAGGGRDEIFGGAGDDILTAGSGNDVIEGGAGDDFIFGALGNDTATGGDGADRFFNSGELRDELFITDYNYAEGDVLVMDGDIHARDAFELRYQTALTADGIAVRGIELGMTTEEGRFQNLFTFGNESDLTQILLRLPAAEDGPVAPILFDLTEI
ncbi:calcium-binding protein [Sulfitobacter sp. F26169L]|uniref:calcium-binding protein n=1 Tax=Sulfitobacter sp. F26169L TaxID=2996015 RepID=UPI002260B0F6|nr:calcium-binding protein [Sulfitobacter sp. F26169L]MCX7566668.1 calcium-binding protein [Sulfitobacter sp. F26169L]